jgi:serpin B
MRKSYYDKLIRQRSKGPLWHTICVVSFLVLLLLLPVACTLPGVDSPAAHAGEVVQSDAPREASPDVAPGDLATLAEGNSAFTWELYQAVRAQEGNLFYSPYSISLALAMTYAGARGETEQQMAETLRFDLPQERLHPAFNALSLELAAREAQSREQVESEEERFRLNIANAIWGQRGYEFLPEFLDTLARNYGAGLRVLDFQSEPEESREVINQWVSDETEEKIENLLPQGTITPDTRLVLTNAVYFNAAWQYPFMEGATREGTFRLLDGSEVTVPMMSQSEGLRYAEGGGWQAIALPYRGVDMSMIVLVPDEGDFSDLEGSLDAAQVESVLSALEYAPVNLTMPKFTYESEFDLTETLAGMGMPAAFGMGPAADFSGMDGTQALQISDVVHKAFVAVDEEGTEAAAATAVVMAESAMMEEVQMTVDRPFIFLIRDNPTGTILFVGRVMDPREEV